MKILSEFLILLSFFSFNAAAKDEQKYILNGEEYTPVPYCDLVQHPKEYDGKRVIIRASLSYGFETRMVFGVKCQSKGYTWLELDSITVMKSFDKAIKHSGIYSATLYGIFHYSNARFCRECSFRFDLRKIENVDTISRGTGWKALKTLSEKAQRKLCQGDEMPKILHSR